MMSTMRTHRTALSVLFLALLCDPLTAHRAGAADASLTLEANSAYVYHGMTYNDGPVLQPYLDVTSGFLGLNVWANYDIGDYHGALKSMNFSEIDMTPYVFTKFKDTDLSLGIAEYSYPNVTTSKGAALPGNREIVASAKRALVGPISAELKIQYEIKEVKDYYARASFFYNLPKVSTNLNVDLIASVAYVGPDEARLVSGGEQGGFNEYNIKGVATYTLTASTKVGATIGYMDSLDKKVLPYSEVNFYGGLCVIRSL